MRSNNGMSIVAHYRHGAKQEEHVDYLSNQFIESGLDVRRYVRTRVMEKTGNECTEYSMETKISIELKSIYDAWYPNGPKIVPKNFELTPTILYHWYVGDGCLVRRNGIPYNIVIATHSFTKFDVEHLMSLIEKEINIVPLINKLTSKVTGKDQYMIRIRKKDVNTFLNYIGDCPMKCYDYKFERIK